MDLNIKWDQLSKGISDQLLGELKTALTSEGLSIDGDIQAYVTRIGVDQVAVLRAPAEKRDALQAELLGQLRTLGEQHRISGNEKAWALFNSAVATVAGTVEKILIAVATAA